MGRLAYGARAHGPPSMSSGAGEFGIGTCPFDGLYLIGGRGVSLACWPSRSPPMAQTAISEVSATMRPSSPPEGHVRPMAVP